MNRIKADLLYKTKREYEEMIRRLENEMQFNHRSFSSREEARILHEIKSLKLGITLLDSYEEKKRLYDEYKAKLTAKKNEQDVCFFYFLSSVFGTLLCYYLNISYLKKIESVMSYTIL